MNPYLFKAYYRSLKIAFYGNQKNYQQLYQRYINFPKNILDTRDEAQLVILNKISLAIKSVQRYAPWKPKCYNLALTTIYILRELEIPHQLYMGFRKNNNELEGHAWVKAGAQVISGERGDLYTYSQIDL